MRLDERIGVNVSGIGRGKFVGMDQVCVAAPVDEAVAGCVPWINETAVEEATVKPAPVVGVPPPSTWAENEPDDAETTPKGIPTPPPEKKIKSKEVERSKVEDSPKSSQDSDLEKQIYASLENVGLTRVVVTLREGKVRLSGQLLRETDRLAVLERVRNITDWVVDDALVFRPDRWLAYRTLNQTYVYSEPSQSSPRISPIGSQYRVWVTEIRDKWVRIESKKGARPGYIRREDVVPEGQNNESTF